MLQATSSRRGTLWRVPSSRSYWMSRFVGIPAAGFCSHRHCRLRWRRPTIPDDSGSHVSWMTRKPMDALATAWFLALACTAQPLAAGDHVRTIEAGGQQRLYRVHVPPGVCRAGLRTRRLGVSRIRRGCRADGRFLRHEPEGRPGGVCRRVSSGNRDRRLPGLQRWRDRRPAGRGAAGRRGHGASVCWRIWEPWSASIRGASTPRACPWEP